MCKLVQIFCYFTLLCHWQELVTSEIIQKPWPNSCSAWFLFFLIDASICYLVENNISQGVWIEKDRKTLGTGEPLVFLIRRKIKKTRANTCSDCFSFLFYWSTYTLFFSWQFFPTETSVLIVFFWLYWNCTCMKSE